MELPAFLTESEPAIPAPHESGLPTGAPEGFVPSFNQPAAAPAAAVAATTGSVIQIGIFSVEANAKRAADTLKAAGIATDTHPGKAQGKNFWSVTTRGDKAVLAKIKQAGFKDAYFLKG